MQREINKVRMYYLLMPDYYRKYWKVEGGLDNICMGIHLNGTETVSILYIGHGERGQDGYETPISRRGSVSTYGLQT